VLAVRRTNQGGENVRFLQSKENFVLLTRKFAGGKRKEPNRIKWVFCRKTCPKETLEQDLTRAQIFWGDQDAGRGQHQDSMYVVRRKNYEGKCAEGVDEWN